MCEHPFVKMTKELARQYFSHFRMDPMLFTDDSQFKPYVYSREQCDARVERYAQLGRIYMTVMLDDEPIGELVLKVIDHGNRRCTLGICLVSDQYKNQGFGTKVEILAPDFAFSELGMEAESAQQTCAGKTGIPGNRTR